MAQLPTTEMRARRFPVRLALHYREHGGRWQSGTTVNLSCSGVLFRARKTLQSLTPVELNLQVPRQLAGAAPVHLLCRGYVVRTAGPRLGLGRPRVAAAFTDFRLLDGAGRLHPAERLRTLMGEGTHEMNNQLAVILGSTELLLERQDLSGDVRDGLLRIRDAATALAAGVRRMAG